MIPVTHLSLDKLDNRVTDNHLLDEMVRFVEASYASTSNICVSIISNKNSEFGEDPKVYTHFITFSLVPIAAVNKIYFMVTILQNQYVHETSNHCVC